MSHRILTGVFLLFGLYIGWRVLSAPQSADSLTAVSDKAADSVAVRAPVCEPARESSEFNVQSSKLPATPATPVATVAPATPATPAPTPAPVAIASAIPAASSEPVAASTSSEIPAASPELTEEEQAQTDKRERALNQVVQILPFVGVRIEAGESWFQVASDPAQPASARTTLIEALAEVGIRDHKHPGSSEQSMIEHRLRLLARVAEGPVDDPAINSLIKAISSLQKMKERYQADQDKSLDKSLKDAIKKLADSEQKNLKLKKPK